MFRERLRGLGFIPGENVMIEDRFADGSEARLREYAAQASRAGLLMSYGPNVQDLYHQAVSYVDKILQGPRAAGSATTPLSASVIPMCRRWCHWPGSRRTGELAITHRLPTMILGGNQVLRLAGRAADEGLARRQC